ncbi:MAG: hypothetical protein WCG01_00185 [bacterium]
MQNKLLKLFFIFTLFFIAPIFVQARTGTPLIFLNAEIETRIQSKMVSNDPTWLALKADADAYAAKNVPAYDPYAWPNGSIPYSYQGQSWLEATEALALAWKVTGNTIYADKLIQIADVIIAAPLTCISVDNGYPTRNVVTATAIIYDWLYDYPALNQNGRKAALISQVNTWFDYYKNHPVYESTGPALSNYFGGHLLGFGLAGMAMDDDNIRGDGIKFLPYMKSLWDSTVAIDFAAGGSQSSGWPQQGFSYGPEHYSRLNQFAFAYKNFKKITTNTDVDIMPSGAVEAMATSLIYNLMPNRWQAPDEGNWPFPYKGQLSPELAMMLTTTLNGTLGDQMAYFVNHMAIGPSGRVGQDNPKFIAALFQDTSRTQTDYRNIQPLIYHSIPDQHVFARSDWSDNAVWSSYNGGSWNWSDHQSKAAGSILLSRGPDQLLANAWIWKGADGISGTPEADDMRGDGNNTLFWNDGGVYNNISNPAYTGGQEGYGTNTNLKHEIGTNFVYMKSDHTSAYEIQPYLQNDANRTLRYFHRNYVNIGGTTIVLYDKIKAKLATYTKELRFHLNKQSTNINSNGIIESTVGQSRLFIKPIAFDGTMTIDVSDAPSVLPRIKLFPAIGVTDWNPLTVIIAGSSTDIMPKTYSIDTVAMSGVLIEQLNPKIVMFSKQMSQGVDQITGKTTYQTVQQNAVTYTAVYSSVGNHILVDIEPALYDVYRDGIKIITATVASSQGVLNFSATGGGVFEVVKTGEAPLADFIAPVAPSGLRVL